MKRLLVLIAFMWYNTAGAQMPGINEVLQHFFARYDNVESPKILFFQKKKDGWYTAEANYPETDNIKNVQRFWDKNNGYATLNYLPREDSSESAIEESLTTYKDYYVSEFEQRQFALHQFYGYAGWNWDVIQELNNKTQLTDEELESLGRSYSIYASGFLFDQYGNHFVNDDPDRIILNDTAAISASRKKKFIQYEWKAIDVFRRLNKQNPAYPTVVGTIGLKLANEHMYAASSLRFAGFEKDADTFIRAAVYPDSLIAISKKLFESIKTNGILITSGDNDTYPLWQMQWGKGYRKDLILINHTLLGLKRQLVYLSKYYKGSLFNTTVKEFMPQEFDFAIYSPGNCKRPVPLNKIRTMMVKISGQRSYTCNEMIMTISPTLAATVFKGKKMLPSMKITLGNYMIANDFIVYDIIDKQFYKRPIYFSWPQQMPGLRDYLIDEGTAYRLAPIK